MALSPTPFGCIYSKLEGLPIKIFYRVSYLAEACLSKAYDAFLARFAIDEPLYVA